jgi:hypothetical protein
MQPSPGPPTSTVVPTSKPGPSATSSALAVPSADPLPETVPPEESVAVIVIPGTPLATPVVRPSSSPPQPTTKAAAIAIVTPRVRFTS